MEHSSTTSLTIDFEADLQEQYCSLKAYIRHRAQNRPGGMLEKQIAMNMDISPSEFTRKLSENDLDPRNFSVDDLERYIKATGDTQPILYLISKYMDNHEAKQDRALSLITELVPLMERALKVLEG